METALLQDLCCCTPSGLLGCLPPLNALKKPLWKPDSTEQLFCCVSILPAPDWNLKEGTIHYLFVSGSSHGKTEPGTWHTLANIQGTELNTKDGSSLGKQGLSRDTGKMPQNMQFRVPRKKAPRSAVASTVQSTRKFPEHQARKPP